jgi:hypothetical protein
MVAAGADGKGGRGADFVALSDRIRAGEDFGPSAVRSQAALRATLRRVRKTSVYLLALLSAGCDVAKLAVQPRCLEPLLVGREHDVSVEVGGREDQGIGHPQRLMRCSQVGSALSGRLVERDPAG